MKVRKPKPVKKVKPIKVPTLKPSKVSLPGTGAAIRLPPISVPPPLSGG